MKAILQDRYGDAEVLRYGETERPVIGADDVLVRVRAAAFGAEAWHLITGRPHLARLFLGLRAPRRTVPGSDVAGVVEAIGANVTRFGVGDEVFGVAAGSFAEFARTTQDSIARKPSRLSFEQAAAVPVSACAALLGLRDAGGLKPGQRVLVIGAAGGVGSYAVQLAVALGAHVTAVTSSTKIDVVPSLGAHEVIDYTTDGLGTGRYDLILDTGGRRPLRVLKRSLTPNGTIVIVGGEGGNALTGGIGRQLGGALLSGFRRQKVKGLMSSEKADELTYLAGLVQSGQVTPLIDRTFPLADTADAMRYFASGKARGKVVLTTG